MKKLLSIALLCSSLIMNANVSWQNWVAPVVVPAVWEVASRLTQDPAKRSGELNVSNVCRHMGESAGCELGKRVLNSGLSMGYEMGNDWQSVVMDSTLNGVSPLVVSYADTNAVPMPQLLKNAMNNPVYRTLLLFACKNVAKSMMPASVPAPAVAAK